MITAEMMKALRDRERQCRSALKSCVNNPRFDPQEALTAAQSAVDMRAKVTAAQAEYDAAQPKYPECDPPPPDMTLDGHRNRATNKGLGH